MPCVPLCVSMQASLSCSDLAPDGKSGVLQFVAKVVFTNTGEIDPNGDFWYIKRKGTKLFKVENIAALTGYSSYSNSNIPDYSSSSGWVYDWSGGNSAWQQTGSEMGYADITYVSADIGEGTNSYLLALSTKKSLSGATRGNGVLLVIRITGESSLSMQTIDRMSQAR